MLKQRFPGLSDADLAAYTAVTRRVLAAGAQRARAMREVMALADAAKRHRARNEPLAPEQDEALRYLRAIEKMQA